MTPTRRSVALGIAAAAAAGPARAQAPSLIVSGRPVQGGALMFLTAPKAPFEIDGAPAGQASERGLFIVGFDRDSPETCELKVARAAASPLVYRIGVLPGEYDVQRVDGLPQDTVTPEAPETLAKIAREAERKAAGFASLIDADYFRDGFEMPLQATRVSGRFGGQRVLNGTPARPHYGADLAAPKGTPVTAPCEGVVSFAETGLHYEGGLIMIDHGQGLVTAYLHLSKVDVAKGDMVRRGQKIAEVGAEGRATGPHLCWRMKWRGRNLDPTLLVGVKSP